MTVPRERIRDTNAAPVNTGGMFVLYWMSTSRRAGWNFALDHAVAWASELGKPLVVCEPLLIDDRWASNRFHAFALQGMEDNAQRFSASGTHYIAFVEARQGDAAALYSALADAAAVVVVDEHPLREHRARIAQAARASIRVEAVDSCGLLPLAATERLFTTAYSFRRFLQRELPEHLVCLPEEDPLSGTRLPALRRLPASIAAFAAAGKTRDLMSLPIDHTVAPVSYRGGARAAGEAMNAFIESRLTHYNEARNEPDQNAGSQLSPYLNFGHLSAHQVFWRVATAEDWDPMRLSPLALGKRAGWWGMSEDAEAFLDQLVTWRELAFNTCARSDNYDDYESLPNWAKLTLEDHRTDDREHVYDLAAFEAAATHDPLWNAAQTELLRHGRIHNYLRMLWGKKILEWSESPRRALDIMIELNNKYAVDGRDPVSYAGVFWIFGRYDRGWPRRPVFGKVRSMSSQRAAAKRQVSAYLRAHAPEVSA